MKQKAFKMNEALVRDFEVFCDEYGLLELKAAEAALYGFMQMDNDVRGKLMVELKKKYYDHSPTPMRIAAKLAQPPHATLVDQPKKQPKK